MSAIECIERVLNTSLINEDLKYCLVNSNKVPYKINNRTASPSNFKDFVDFEQLLECKKLERYSGIGISVQASKVCAIDIDRCAEEPFNIETINDFALEIIDIFKDFAYIEFSFSGRGIRILFKQDSIKDYQSKYRIKNSDIDLEYYDYDMLGRYVTVTGRYLFNNSLSSNENYNDLIIEFLEKYMKKKNTISITYEECEDDRTIEELMKVVKFHYRKDYDFQDLWFSKAPGSGKDESERDYFLVRYIFNNITRDREKVKEIFEQSDFFKTKDRKHIYKWTRSDNYYFNYIFNNIKG